MKKIAIALFCDVLTAFGAASHAQDATQAADTVAPTVAVAGDTVLPTFKTFYIITSDNARNDISFTADKGGDLKGHLRIDGKRCLVDTGVQIKDEGEYFVTPVPLEGKPLNSKDVEFCASLELTVKLPKKKSFFGYAGVMELRMKGAAPVWLARFQY